MQPKKEVYQFTLPFNISITDAVISYYSGDQYKCKISPFGTFKHVVFYLGGCRNF